METAAPPYRINLALTAAAFAVTAAQLVLVPVVLLPDASNISIAAADMVAIVVTVLLSFSTPFIRALLHEAIHNRLARKRSWNDGLGRALGVCTGGAFDAIRLGHMTHHRFPRHALDRADIIEPGKSRVGASLTFYSGLLGGLYLREVLLSLVMLLPRRVINWMAEHLMSDDAAHGISLQGALRRGLDRRLSRIRLDAVLVVLVYGGAFYLYGAWWPVLLVAIALRGFVVSLQDNVAHYGTPAVIGAPAHNARATRWTSLLLLNQNYHGVHHEHPEVPWTQLPAAFSRTRSDFTAGYFALLTRQFRGPLPPDATVPAQASKS
jgi:fatty acid desaturase